MMKFIKKSRDVFPFVIACLFFLSVKAQELGNKKTNERPRVTNSAMRIMTKYSKVIDREVLPELKKADERMNEMLDEIISQHKSDTIFVKKLNHSQQLWEQLMVANVEAIFSDQVTPLAYGDAESGCRLIILLQGTNKRIEFLNGWVEGILEGDVCSGSRKMKRR